MGYYFPTPTPTPKAQLLQGVKVENGNPYMKEDSEMRHIYGQPYINTANHEIIIR